MNGPLAGEARIDWSSGEFGRFRDLLSRAYSTDDAVALAVEAGVKERTIARLDDADELWRHCLEAVWDTTHPAELARAIRDREPKSWHRRRQALRLLTGERYPAGWPARIRHSVWLLRIPLGVALLAGIAALVVPTVMSQRLHRNLHNRYYNAALCFHVTGARCPTSFYDELSAEDVRFRDPDLFVLALTQSMGVKSVRTDLPPIDGEVLSIEELGDILQALPTADRVSLLRRAGRDLLGGRSAAMDSDPTGGAMRGRALMYFLDFAMQGESEVEVLGVMISIVDSALAAHRDAGDRRDEARFARLFLPRDTLTTLKGRLVRRLVEVRGPPPTALFPHGARPPESPSPSDPYWIEIGAVAEAEVGCPLGAEPDCGPAPLRSTAVALSGFRLLSEPVTRAQMRAFLPETEDSSAADPARVSWYAATAFAAWSGAALPTEAQWESACSMAPNHFGGQPEWTADHLDAAPPSGLRDPTGLMLDDSAGLRSSPGATCRHRGTAARQAGARAPHAAFRLVTPR